MRTDVFASFLFPLDLRRSYLWTFTKYCWGSFMLASHLNVSILKEDSVCWLPSGHTKSKEF
jgi:hypothetical protein